MKKNTYPVAENAQAIAYRQIFDSGYSVDPSTKDVTTTNPGRIKGINNSTNLVKLFKNSPFYTADTIDDRGNLIDLDLQGQTLTNDIISSMFETVIDGSENNQKPHVLKLGTPGDFTDTKNYNWLYRDQPMDMNFRYLKPEGDASNNFIPSSPTVDEAPVGSNSPINNATLTDKPFWGHANLQVPSIDPAAARDDHAGKPQLIRGSGGFGTNYPISNRPFAAQEKIGTYFTNVYQGTSENNDRMAIIAGKSINTVDNEPTTDNSAYGGDINIDGTPDNQGKK